MVIGVTVNCAHCPGAEKELVSAGDDGIVCVIDADQPSDSDDLIKKSRLFCTTGY